MPGLYKVTALDRLCGGGEDVTGVGDIGKLSRENELACFYQDELPAGMFCPNGGGVQRR